MNLDRDHLATLRAVVDAGTFDAAATALSVTPSAVSQRIKALEQQLGRVLVERSKPVRATESGEVLLRLAREIALLEADAAAALRLDDSD
jgi:LysR family transcriptional regulator (chromosome initiation inhibitor)